MPRYAIIGRAVLAAGVQSPDQLWRAVLDGTDLTSEAPAGRFGIAAERFRCDPPVDGRLPDNVSDGAWTHRGGFVRQRPDERDGLDRVFGWTRWAAEQALADAGVPESQRARVGMYLGNLSFPAPGLTDYVTRRWMERADGLGAKAADSVGFGPVDPRNRFMSGLPALRLRETLGLGGPLVAFDAACASSLFAVKYAMDRLEEGAADVMLAGGINAADNVFIHGGFCALAALSHSGRSQPFAQEADGLLPSEGIALVVLKRLADAERDGDTILGVVRGVGLSNDGRPGGFLGPSVDGQVDAMRKAYTSAQLTPDDVSYVECHATGTPVGDGAELRSMHQVFGSRRLPIGSLKSNLGHMITAAGGVALIKVLEALAHKTMPPMRLGGTPLPELRALGFDAVTTPRPWTGPLRAAVSAFGFGGNNAHLIVEAWEHGHAQASAPPAKVPLAVVGLGMVAGSASDADEVARVLFSGGAHERRTTSVSLPLRGLRFPPRDLQQTLGQQTTVLAAARQAIARVTPPSNTGVFVGMQTDADVPRFAFRVRLAEWAHQWGCDDAWLATARDGVVPQANAAAVMGLMPNIPANRINAWLDLRGAGHTVSTEDSSGLDGLELAWSALSRGELDMALVGAVDMCCVDVHEDAVAAITDRPAGDVSVMLLVQRLDDAQAAGHPILAVLGGPAGEPWPSDRTAPLGYAHAAEGLTQLGAAVLSQSHLGARTWTVSHTNVVGIQYQVGVGPGNATWTPPEPVQGMHMDFPGHPPALAVPARPGTAPFMGWEELLAHAMGPMTTAFGPDFADHDAMHHRVKMPAPPLLLVDRILDVDGEAGSMGTGSLRSDTLVPDHAWYVHRGNMPAGIVIESGQADMLMISWLGVDRLNGGDRVYRLLGCELVWHGTSLPKAGERIDFDISVDGHATAGAARLFFFTSRGTVNGEPRLTVQRGQAGFFTYEELSGAAGVIVDPARIRVVEEPRLDPPAIVCEHAAFNDTQVLAFAQGRPWACFGRGFEGTRAHRDTPRISYGPLKLLDRMTTFQPRGGPWGRGYASVELDLHPDDWYFDGHFMGDPCLPGSMMYQGGLHAMALYLAAMGYTADRDGWKFVPVPNERCLLKCRGQATPAQKQLVCEVWVEECFQHPYPTLFADLVGSVDGAKTYHARRVGLQLVPPDYAGD